MPLVVKVPKNKRPAGVPTQADESATINPVDAGNQSVKPPNWLERTHRDVAAWLSKRGWSNIRLVLAALVLAGLAGACFALSHPGVGALLALPAIVLAWFARPEGSDPNADVLQPETKESSRALVLVLSEVVTFALFGGLILDAASDGSSFRALVLTVALAACLLLSLTRALGRAGGSLPRGPTLWTWSERLLVLVVGTLMGKIGIAVFLVATISVVDLLVRLHILNSDEREEFAIPPVFRGLYQPSGEILGSVRFATLLAAALLFVVLPKASDWRW